MPIDTKDDANRKSFAERLSPVDLLRVSSIIARIVIYSGFLFYVSCDTRGLGAEAKLSQISEFFYLLYGRAFVDLDMKNLNLKIIRIQTGLTQLQLAEKSGISLSRISRIEAGYAVPHLDELKAFSCVLGACVCRKLKAYQPISTKSKEQIISTRQNKSFPNSPFKIFAVLFTVLAVLAIVKGLDATAAISTACLFLLIFAKFLPNWEINFKDYFSFHNGEK